MTTSLLERAKRFMQPAVLPDVDADTRDERNESDELSQSAALTGDIGPNAAAKHTPPDGCIASRTACPVLGPCDRHVAGSPCLVTYFAQEETAA